VVGDAARKAFAATCRNAGRCAAKQKNACGYRPPI
jgi:hypothetical protein